MQSGFMSSKRNTRRPTAVKSTNSKNTPRVKGDTPYPAAMGRGVWLRFQEANAIKAFENRLKTPHKALFKVIYSLLAI
jgi:hypothetical protein